MSITPKQQRFVDEYIIDLNATQAAIRAGYSPKTAEQQASRLLSIVKIKVAIQKAIDKRAKRTEITQDRVLEELAKIGFADIRKVVSWGDTEISAGLDDKGNPKTEVHYGLSVVGSDKIDDHTAAAISEISEGRDGIKIKMHDKRAALVDLGRHLGMFKDRIEHSGIDGAPIQTQVQQTIDLSKLTDEELQTLERIAASNARRDQE